MIREIDGQWWYCCPRCGKKLNPLQAGAVCRGVLTRCRGFHCGWSGEIIVKPGDWGQERSSLPA